MASRFVFGVSLLALLSLLLTAGDVVAARLSSQPRKGYQRINFTFDAPAKLNVTNQGNVLVLSFSSPLGHTPETLRQALGGNVKQVVISKDGKTVTLTMSKPLRTRHFVSGKTVGLDLMDAEPTEMAETTSITQGQAATPDAILTTKKQPTAAAPKEAKPAEVALKKKPEATPTPKAEKKQAIPEPTPKPMATEPAASVAVQVPEAIAPDAPPSPVAATAPGKPAGGFLVTVKQEGNAAVLNFPYSERTAAAVFERGNAIWIVFSRPSDVGVPLLKTVLPNTVKDAVQYAYAGNTVLRLTTDGTVHASASNPNGSFSWNITLAATASTPANAIGIGSEALDSKNRLLATAFDVAPTLKFYDPIVGDLLLVIPSFESNHGMSVARHFPELSVLASAQGMAVVSSRSDLTTHSSRLGLSIEAPGGLTISQNLAVMNQGKAPVLGLNSGVLLPYTEWFVPTAKFKETLLERQRELANATKDSRPEALYALATLYLGQGMGTEALGYLDLLAANEPEFFKARKIALLSAAAHALEGHTDSAATMLSQPELQDVKEAELWREYIGLFSVKANPVQQELDETEKAVRSPNFFAAQPGFNLAEDREDYSANTPPPAGAPEPPPSKPLMRFLKYNRAFIRFYPPRIRQMLVAAAADAYLANGLEQKALAAYDTLNRDDILGPMKYRAEFAVARAAQKNKKNDQADEIFTRLSVQLEDPRTRAQAMAAGALLRMQTGKLPREEALDAVEQARMAWRGDALEMELLRTLAQLYREGKQYDEALRSLKTIVDQFPSDPDYLIIFGEMSDLFEQLYLGGVADEMPPLKSLSLFYEFRELTPVGEKGDLIIQKLADRLAAFDLIERATQLLENQVNFRLGGEARSRVGAKLALLYLFNHQPQEALKVLESTNYGQNTPELQRQRLQLTAQALSSVGRHTDALTTIYSDSSDVGQLLKLDILWASQDWPNVVNAAEEILARRTDLTAQLTPTETEVLMKLALGYSFQSNYNQLRYLKDYYGNLIPESGYKQMFEFITNDTTPLDREDSAMLKEQITRTESFMNLFREKILGGKLSEALTQR